jgi:hypothetical protein
MLSGVTTIVSHLQVCRDVAELADHVREHRLVVGLVHGDHLSYLWRKGKRWKPELPSKTPGDFTMADLLRFVGDIPR